MIITIDGPSGTGKGTAARGLAKHLRIHYFDTGAMYRSFALYALNKGVSLEPSPELFALLHSFTFEISGGEERRYLCCHKDVTEEIRSAEVTEASSIIAQYPQVRTRCVELQRAAAQSGGDWVFEGRDLGTVVFPQAEYKFFLTASPEVRAERRYREWLARKGPKITKEQVLVEQEERDARDRNRSHSPLKPAKEAEIIDTSFMTKEEVLQTLLAFLPNPSS